jgi:hydrogenase-4 component E
MPNLSQATNLVDSLAALALLAALLMVITKRTDTNVRLMSFQALALAATAGAVGYFTGNRHMYLAAGFTIVIKGVAIPYFIFYIIDKIGVTRKMERYLSTKASLIIAVGLVVLAYYVVEPSIIPQTLLTKNCLPISVAMILIGLFLMISRKKALTQMMGIIVMENGLFLAAVATTYGMPLVVELGIFFDLLVGVLIMGILAFRINQTFDSINTVRLQKLKG